MIGYLKGHVLTHQDGRLLLTISSGSSGAVGYLMHVPHSPAYGALLPGSTAELFIYTHVREDVLDLFGFMSSEEKDLFLTLTSVNGIGPKVALGILSAVDPGTLIDSILRGDKVGLTRLPGVGKKTAERVVLELGDSLQKKVAAGQFSKLRAHGAALSSGAVLTHASAEVASESQLMRDARDALMGLGYRDQDISGLLKKIMDAPKPPTKVEDVIRVALQRIS